MRTIALIGDPVSGRASPAMHNAAFRRLGLHFEYELLRIPLGGLTHSFASLRERYAGLNITIPHKEEAARLVDVLRPRASASGSVNTVIFRDGRAMGDSTDGAGFLQALRRDVGTRTIRAALILGTGGAARAVAAALAGEGIIVRVSGRNDDAGRRLARDIAGVEVVPQGDVATALGDAELLVSAVPGSAWDEEFPPIPRGMQLGPGKVVFDLVYRPRRTPLLQRAHADGSTVIEGVEMLVEQGGLSFTLWTDVPAPLSVMRQAAYAELAAVSA